jgi:two-component system, sensor histidine kinase
VAAENSLFVHGQERVLDTQIRMMVSQSKSGFRRVTVIGLLLGFVLQPAAGWGLYAFWYATVLALFTWRDMLHNRMLSNQVAASFEDIAHVSRQMSLLLGIAISASAPVFFPYLSDAGRAFVTAILCAWCAAAATVLGSYPPCYGRYVWAFAANVWVAWIFYGTTEETIAIGGFVASGAIVLVQFSARIGELIEESVHIRNERNEFVSQLESALEENRRSQATRARFLAAASHDMRQPVHAMSLLAGLLRRYSTNDRQREIVENIELTAAAMDTMFVGLIDMARIDSGTIIPKIRVVDLVGVADGLEAAYAFNSRSKGVEFIVERPKALFVFADQMMIERVLRNLVDNAVKFTSSGFVRLRLESQGEGAHLVVEDSGDGIPESDIDKVFEAFYRGSSARHRDVEGVGLGLSVAAHFARLMEMGLQLESSCRGTVVKITAKVAPSPKTTPGQDKSAFHLPSRLVAVLEDDRAARDATVLWLEEHGCRVVAAPGLEELLAVLFRITEQPAFILADYMLEGGNGVQAINRIRSLYGNIPAGLVTGEESVTADEIDGVPVLHKPIKVEQLEKMLDQAIGAN